MAIKGNEPGSGAKNDYTERLKAYMKEHDLNYNNKNDRDKAEVYFGTDIPFGTTPTVTRDNGDKATLKIKVEFEQVGYGRGSETRDGKRTVTFVDTITGNEYSESGELIKVGEVAARIKDLSQATKDRLKKYGKRKQGGVLRYPAEALTQHADYLQIDIERYAEIGKSSYVSDTGGSSRYVIGTRKQNRAGMTSGVSLTRRPLINDGTILLPIPSNISDANNVSYGESRLNGLAAAGISAAESTANKGIDALFGGESIDIKEEADVLGKKIVNMMGGDGSTAALTAADVITKQLTASAVNIFDANVTANQLLARSNGEIINPNLEILFSDVTLRNFGFKYKLTPRNKYEAEQVKLIIRAFKRNMAPQAIGSDGASDFFLRSPNVFKLRYRSGNKDHPFLNKFKQCFLSDMQTRYTGEGIYSTYDDGTPVSIELSLSFKEIQPIYDIDYDERPGTQAVGY